MSLNLIYGVFRHESKLAIGIAGGKQKFLKLQKQRTIKTTTIVLTLYTVLTIHTIYTVLAVLTLYTVLMVLTVYTVSPYIPQVDK